MSGDGNGGKRLGFFLRGSRAGACLVCLELGNCDPVRSASEHLDRTRLAEAAEPPLPLAPSTAPTLGAKQDEPSPEPPELAASRLVNYHFESPKLGAVPVVVRVPTHRVGQRMPALLLLHGRGEAQKAPERGARGYLDDYGLEAAWQWLDSPQTVGPPKELTEVYARETRRRLEAAPFTGMVLVFPYLPDRFRGSEAFLNASEYAGLLREVMTRVKAELPVRPEAEAWALDGISLGGRVALLCTSHLAAELGASGSVQAAIDERELGLFADVLAEARKNNPKLQHTLATSEQDYFRGVLTHYHAQLTARGLAHEWVTLPGDHSYAFNRGPGVVHLLTSYDRWFSRD